jgi:chitosanase
MVTDLQKKTIKAIVNIFETSKVLGNYGQVTLLKGDTGHLTYGRSQTTLGSGNLHKLIEQYVNTPGAAHADDLRPYLQRLEERDISLDHDENLKTVLREAGDDPVMQTVQDEFFDVRYWKPCLESAAGISLADPLCIAVVYDSHIHGSWERMRDRTHERHGRPHEIGERAWAQRYVDERHNWLGTHSNTLLHKTTYRMDSFRDLMAAEQWELGLPLVVRGIRITERTLAGEKERLLKKTDPMMRGDDVRELQQALKGQGIQVDVDGVFGPGTEAAVKEYQRNAGLSVDGKVGGNTRTALGI